MNLRALHAKAMAIMAGYFADNRQLPTTLIGLAEDKRLHMFFVPKYPEKRQLFEAIFPAYFFNHKISSYAYCSEAWVSQRTVEEGYIRPSKDPKRIEVLLTGAVDYDNMLSEIFRIDRSGKRPAVGKPLYPPEEKKHLEVYREGMNGLLPAKNQKVREDLRHLVGLLLDETERRDYFTKKILSQAEYENVN